MNKQKLATWIAGTLAAASWAILPFADDLGRWYAQATRQEPAAMEMVTFTIEAPQRSLEERAAIILEPAQEAVVEEVIEEPEVVSLHPRVEQFYNQFVGEQSHDIETRIERTSQYDSLIREAAERYDLPVNILYALIVKESGGDPNARNAEGDTGLTQINGITVRELERLGHPCPDRTDPETSIDCGAFYLRHLMDMFGSLEMGLAAYNIGQGNVTEAIEGSGSSDYHVTFPEGHYVTSVMALGLRVSELVE